MIEHRQKSVEAQTQTEAFPELTNSHMFLPLGDQRPTFTPVKPFTSEQATQVNLETCEQATQVRLDAIVEPYRGTTCAQQALLTENFMTKRFQNALERNMSLAQQARAKSHEVERMFVKMLRLGADVQQAQAQTKEEARKVRNLERSLQIAKGRDAITNEYQNYLKKELNEVRGDLEKAKQKNLALVGEADLSSYSMEQLEELENSLSKGAERVRDALRAKYNEALEENKKQDLCLVCRSRPVTVVLLPCRHQVLCSSCALRVSSCPVDRKEIRDKILTYGLRAFIA